MTRFCSMIAVLAAVCVLCSGTALAAKGKLELSAYRFEELDKDGDGKISISELTSMSKNADQATKLFRQGDKDGDKYLSKDEFKSLQGAKKEQHKKKK
jgi:Ca2+-binding EF-hand superfamily protein